MNLYYSVFQQAEARTEARDQEKQCAAALLRHVLWAERGLRPEELQREIGPHGKPGFRGIDFHYNISHTGGMVALATGKSAVGVDCEGIRTLPWGVVRRVCNSEELARLHCSPNPEEEFYRLWTLKEAFVKWLGVGLRYPLKKVTLEGEGNIHAVYPELKIYSTVLNHTALCAMEYGGAEINLQKVDWLS